MPNLRRPVNNASSRNYLNACKCIRYDLFAGPSHCLARYMLCNYAVSITVDSTGSIQTIDCTIKRCFQQRNQCSGQVRLDFFIVLENTNFPVSIYNLTHDHIKFKQRVRERLLEIVRDIKHSNQFAMSLISRRKLIKIKCCCSNGVIRSMTKRVLLRVFLQKIIINLKKYLHTYNKNINQRGNKITIIQIWPVIILVKRSSILHFKNNTFHLF